MQFDLIWTIVGFVLTLLVLSYIFGDNPLFRIATYLFVGVSAGVVAVVIFYQVLVPKLLWPFITNTTPTEKLLTVIVLLFSLLLLAKLVPAISGLGNLPMAYLVGVGAAVIIGGAVTGTIFAQSQATMAAFRLADSPNPALQLADGILILFGTIATLAYFHFGARTPAANQPPVRMRLIGGMASVGQVFIGITLGALFAGVIAASITVLVERLNFFWFILFSQIL